MSLFVGLMSGTSVDAIDAVLVEFSKHSIELKAVYLHPWPTEIRQSLLHLSQQIKSQSRLHEIAMLEVQTAECFATATLELLKQAQILPDKVCAIGSPGQTLYHHPQGTPAYTWQLGDPNLIAQFTGITTVADFRRRDLAAGGQGAPLAPAFHQAVFYTPQEDRTVLNIGGIANITVLPADSNLPVIGFDTGPGNALLDAFIEQQRGSKMDIQGNWAKSGKIQENLLNLLLTDDYFTRPAPKSTGRDYFNLNWLQKYFEEAVFRPEDIQATLGQLTITTIAHAVRPYKPHRLLVCGGGVHNPFLMNGLTKELPDCMIESTLTQGIDPDWVEAMCFAWLAKQRLDGRPSNLPSVTGARQAVVLGGIYL